MSRLLATIVGATLLSCASPALASPRVPAYHGEAELLIDEAELLPALERLIGGARRSVAADWFVFCGPAAERLAQAMLERRRAGVAVAVLLDPGLGFLPALRAQAVPLLARLRAGGIDVRLWRAPADRRGAHDHNKLVVVDEEVAVVASMNLGGPLLVSHDMGVRVTGGAARAIAREFLAAWRASGQPAEPDGWPAHTHAARLGDSEIRVLPTDPAHPHEPWRPARATVLAGLAAAEASIEAMLLKLGDEGVVDALGAAARRGVAVRVLLDPGRHGRLLPGGWAPEGLFNLRAARRLAEAGAAVRWYRPRPGELALHVKAARIDGRELLIGTTNWTADGFVRNRETMLAIAGGRAPARFGEAFERAWQERADAPSWAPRPLLDAQTWLYDGLARLVE